MKTKVTPFAFAAVLAASALIAPVAGAQGEATSATVAAAKKVKTNRDVILRTELDAKPSANLYDVVSSLRSHWIRGPATAKSTMSIGAGTFSRAGAGAGDPANDPNMPTVAGGAIAVVYIDGRPFGTPAALRDFPSSSAEKLCYFTVNRAQGRFGLAVESPVIEVFTRNSAHAETGC